MFFYSALFVASVIVAFIILYLYNALADIGRAVYQAILPSSKDNLAGHLDNQRVRTTVNETKTPWGWESQASPSKLAKIHPALPVPADNTPWGWPGNNQEIREHGQSRRTSNEPGLEAYFKRENFNTQPEKTRKSTVGWPYRDESFDFAGEEYKVTRKTPKKTNLKTTGKPWGW
jgi:hypothetical protein